MRNTSLLLNRRQFVAASAGAATLLAAPSLARADTWPNKPIRMLAGSAAGGQTDQFARVYGEYLSRELGQTVVVENKAGAGGAVAATELKRADPDGHTLMICNTTAYMLNPVLIKDIKYNVAQDFAWVAVMPGRQPSVPGQRKGRRKDPAGVHRLCPQGRQGEYRDLRRRVLCAHGDCRTQQAIRPQDRSRALSRRGADVAGRRRTIDRWRYRQLRRGVAGDAGRQGRMPLPCRVAVSRIFRMSRRSGSRAQPPAPMGCSPSRDAWRRRKHRRMSSRS